jgi:hypothetical protein
VLQGYLVSYFARTTHDKVEHAQTSAPALDSSEPPPPGEEYSQGDDIDADMIPF